MKRDGTTELEMIQEVTDLILTYWFDEVVESYGIEPGAEEGYYNLGKFDAFLKENGMIWVEEGYTEMQVKVANKKAHKIIAERK